MDIKVDKLQQSLSRAAKADRTRKFYSLYDKVCRVDVLLEALNRVKEKKGAPGTDGKSIEDIEKYGTEIFLKEIATELKEQTYKPSPLRRVWIPKSNGGKRGLAIPTVKDRVVQTAVKLVIEPIFEADFEPNSYGFRPDKSAIDAISEVTKWLNFGCENVIDADIKACFDTMPKGGIIEQVAKRISDGMILKLISQWLNVGIIDSESLLRTEEGTPQGSPISPLLANIYLDQLDKGWKQTGLPKRKDAHLVRYADDFVILGNGDMTKPMQELDRIISSINLSLNKEKTRIITAEQGFEFLGFRFVRYYSRTKGKRVTKWFPSGKSEGKITDEIRRLTDKSNLAVGTPYDAKEKILRVLRGWGGYFRHSMAEAAFSKVWYYANVRLGRMNRRWHHQNGGIGRHQDNKDRGLVITDTIPKAIPYAAYNAAR
jgi:group II intron reverse transcriptase/maturase